MDITIPSSAWYFFRWLASGLRLKANNFEEKKATEFIRKKVCDFQIDYINFHFKSAELHKTFRVAYDLDANSNDTSNAYNKLTHHIEFNAKKMCSLFSELIKDFFALTRFHTEPPRVGIHISGEDDSIIEISSKSGTPPPSKSLDAYTCFNKVMGDGRPHLDNNLPKTVINSVDGFCHGRLDVEKTKNEYKWRYRFWNCLIIARPLNNYWKTVILDKKWNEMAGVDGNATMYYKSHLIVPITFLGHSRRYDYSEKLKRVLNLRDDGRSVIGFLCIDHPTTYYFDGGHPKYYDNLDINICYLFADLLSFVFVTKLMFTDQSDTYKAYKTDH